MSASKSLITLEYNELSKKDERRDVMTRQGRFARDEGEAGQLNECRKTGEYSINRWAEKTVVCSAAAILSIAVLIPLSYSGQIEDETSRVVYSDEPVALQGRICREEYSSGGSAIIIEYWYWGIADNKIKIKRVVWEGDSRKEETVEQILNPMGVCIFEPTPGKKLSLELDRFNQLMVSAFDRDEIVAPPSPSGTVQKEEE